MLLRGDAQADGVEQETPNEAKNSQNVKHFSLNHFAGLLPIRLGGNFRSISRRPTVTENDSSSAPDRNLLTTFETLPPARGSPCVGTKWISRQAHPCTGLSGVAADAIVQRAMRRTSPETKRRYQLGMTDQVRQAVEKANEKIYGREKVLRFYDVRPDEKKEGAKTVCK